MLFITEAADGALMDKNLRLLVLSLPRPAKRAIVIVVDIGLVILSVWIAFYLRLGYF